MVDMNIVGVDAEQPRGVTFPVKHVIKPTAPYFLCKNMIGAISREGWSR